jgi:hypothetical protein
VQLLLLCDRYEEKWLLGSSVPAEYEIPRRRGRRLDSTPIVPPAYTSKHEPEVGQMLHRSGTTLNKRRNLAAFTTRKSSATGDKVGVQGQGGQHRRGKSNSKRCTMRTKLCKRGCARKNVYLEAAVRTPGHAGIDKTPDLTPDDEPSKGSQNFVSSFTLPKRRCCSIIKSRSKGPLVPVFFIMLIIHHAPLFMVKFWFPQPS